MLHITLTILKIIGIILLVLILLVIAVLLALLFVPLRYRIQAVYTDEQMRGELRLTWLLHLISVRLALAEESSSSEKGVTDTIGVDTEGTDTETSSDSVGQQLSRFTHIRPYSEVRILGIRLESFLAFFGKTRSGKSNHGASGSSAGRRAARKQTSKKQVPQKQGDEKQIPEKQAPRTQPPQGSHTSVNRTESLDDAREDGKRQDEASDGAKNHEELFQGKAGAVSSEDTKAGDEAAEKAAVKDKSKNVKEAEEKAAGESMRQGDTQNRKKNEEADPEDGFSRKFGNLLYKLSNICDKIRQMPSLLKQLCGQIKELLSKPGQIKERVSRLVRKLEKYQAFEVLSEVWSELKHLLHHYRVRDGSGYIRFGTGDPALTGEITGVLYLVFPASCGDIAIEPQFTQVMFETELQIRGHIRAVHMVKTAWWTFRNKKLRRLIRAFR